MNAQGGLQYKKGSKVVRVSSYVLTHTGGKAKLTAIVNGHRTTIATMSSPKSKTSGNTGTMSRRPPHLGGWRPHQQPRRAARGPCRRDDRSAEHDDQDGLNRFAA